MLDKGIVEAAFRRHLEAANLAPRPLRWAGDADEAYQILRAQGWPLDAWWEEMELVSLQDRDQPYFEQWSNGADQRPGVVAGWLEFMAWQAAITWPEVLVFREASRESLASGERPPRGYLRGSSLCAAIAAAWKPGLKRMQAVWEPLIQASANGLWAFAVLSHEVIAVPRPIIRTRGQRLLHHERSPAVEWAEPGGAWWMLDGIRVPRHAVQDPASISIQEIAHEENAALRRVLVRRLGLERFLIKFGARPHQEDRFGCLLRVRFVDEDLLVVKVRNTTPEVDGTHREYFLQVPPNLRTAREAVAWTFGLRAEDYDPIKET